MKEITIDKDKLVQAYKTATDEQKQLLADLYGEEIFRPRDDFAFKLYERGYIYIAERPRRYVKTILEAQGVTYELQYHPRRPAALCGGYTFDTYIVISRHSAKGRKLLLSREPYDPDAAENFIRDFSEAI